MATAAMPRMGGDIKLEYGRAEVFALKFITGKDVPSRYPGGRVMFTAMDEGEGERKLFLDGEDGSDLERALREMGVQPGEYIRVTKIKLAHGGGHAIRVARHSDAAEVPAPSRLEAQLEKSIEMARNARGGRGAGASGETAPATNSTNTDYTTRSHVSAPRSASHPEARAPQALPEEKAMTPASAKLCSTVCAMLDAMAEASAFAARRGLAVSTEDLRALVVTAFIQDSRGGR